MKVKENENFENIEIKKERKEIASKINKCNKNYS